MNLLPLVAAYTQAEREIRLRHGLTAADLFWMLACWDYQHAGGFRPGFIGTGKKGVRPLKGEKDKLVKEGMLSFDGTKYLLTKAGSSVMISLNRAALHQKNLIERNVLKARRAYAYLQQDQDLIENV